MQRLFLSPFAGLFPSRAWGCFFGKKASSSLTLHFSRWASTALSTPRVWMEPWTLAEDLLLIDVMHHQSKSTKHLHWMDWIKLARQFPNKNSYQVHRRWHEICTQRCVRSTSLTWVHRFVKLQALLRQYAAKSKNVSDMLCGHKKVGLAALVTRLLHPSTVYHSSMNAAISTPLQSDHYSSMYLQHDCNVIMNGSLPCSLLKSARNGNELEWESELYAWLTRSFDCAYLLAASHYQKWISSVFMKDVQFFCDYFQVCLMTGRAVDIPLLFENEYDLDVNGCIIVIKRPLLLVMARLVATFMAKVMVSFIRPLPLGLSAPCEANIPHPLLIATSIPHPPLEQEIEKELQDDREWHTFCTRNAGIPKEHLKQAYLSGDSRFVMEEPDF